jgi:hypothetical protein
MCLEIATLKRYRSPLLFSMPTNSAEMAKYPPSANNPAFHAQNAIYINIIIIKLGAYLLNGCIQVFNFIFYNYRGMSAYLSRLGYRSAIVGPDSGSSTYPHTQMTFRFGPTASPDGGTLYTGRSWGRFFRITQLTFCNLREVNFPLTSIMKLPM